MASIANLNFASSVLSVTLRFPFAASDRRHHSAAIRHGSKDSGPLWRKPHAFSRAMIHRCVSRMPFSRTKRPLGSPPCFLSSGTSAHLPEDKMAGCGLVPFVPQLLRGGMGGCGLVPRLRYQVRLLTPSASHGFARVSELVS